MTRSKDIPLFGPLFPKGAHFPRSPAFRDFLLAKVINAENAAEKSEKFRSMATRTRQEYLKDLAENYVTTTPIDSSTKFPLLSLGCKRKDKMKGAKGAELHSAGALVWAVIVKRAEEGEGGDPRLPCLLGVSAEAVVLIERCSRRVVFNCSCRDVIGWKAVSQPKDGGPRLDVFYERGESVSIGAMENQAEDIREVVQRLEVGGWIWFFRSKHVELNQINKSTIAAVQQRTGPPVTVSLESHVYGYSLRAPVRFQVYVVSQSTRWFEARKCDRQCPTLPTVSLVPLQLVTRGCEAFEVTPLRDGVGQPGFLMNEEGFVTDLQRFCYAESGGLQLWARVVRLCGHSLVHLSPEERTKLLRTAHKIHITVIPPDENGKPRR